MAAYAGKDGYFQLDGGRVAYIDNYSITINAGSVDKTSIGDEWTGKLATQKSWNGSASGTLDLADKEQSKVLSMFTGAGSVEAQQLVFGLGGGSFFRGKATISNIQIGASVSDKITFSFSFEGDGPLDLNNQYDGTTVAMPGISVEGDGTDSVKVSVVCATAGASVMYMLDDEEHAYTAPVEITDAGPHVFKAWATKTGMSDSAISSKRFAVAE